MNQIDDLTDEEIQAQLAGESVRGPRTFRGRALAPLSRGLRDLRNKVIATEDTGTFHDLALLHILAEAHAAAPMHALAKRRQLILDTDDVATFRATVSLILDNVSDAEIVEARAVVNDILGIVEKAEVSLAEKKSAAGPVELSPTTTLSP